MMAMCTSHTSVIKELQKLADPAKAKLLQGFFKTGKGQYAEGDVFLGVMVPKQRLVAKKYKSLPLREIQHLLSSHIHEYRFTALVILSMQYRSAGPQEREKIYAFYLKNHRYINNWDLVDVFAPQIVGQQLLHGSRDILFRFVRSKNLWERRIAVLSTFMFIHHGDFSDSLRMAELLLSDPHDLMHKAVGWMLREIGKRDPEVERSFLNRHASRMPRTMLRYAIERFSEKERKKYLLLRRAEQTP